MAATSDDANKVDRDAREAGAADEMGVDAMDDEAAWDTTRIPAVVVDDDDVTSTTNEAAGAPVPPAAKPDRRDARIAVWAAGGLLVLLGVAYPVAHLMAADTAPRNASVNGVQIGGMSVQEATETLTSRLSATDAAPLILAGEPGQQVSLDPASSGLAVDYQATVQRAGAGSSWDPRILIKVITGGGETSPVVNIDREQLGAAVAALAPDFTREPADAQITFDGGDVQRTPMVTGTALDIEGTVEAVASAFAEAVRRPVDGPRDPYQASASLKVTEPAITDAMVDPIEAQLATVLQPISVTTAQAQAEITAARIAQVTTVAPVDGRLDLSVDSAALYDVATEVIDALSEVRPQNATWQISGGVPVLMPAVDGRSVTRESFAAGVKSVIGEPAPRSFALEVTDVAAEFTTEQARALGIQEVVGEFTTYFGHTTYHNTNLGLAAAGINNELVKPGETFSLAKATGPRNASTGYVEGGVLVGDHIEYIVGGGVSQSATTTYNAAFFAGMTDVEHHPHTQYFSQYPPGREATVYEGVLDLKFRNDTPYGVLLQAYIVPSSPGAQGSITVRVWSTRYFDSVQATDPVMSNYTTGSEQVSARAGCVPQSPSQGFDVSFQRILTLNGQSTTEDYFWRYSPVDRITCR